MSAITPPCCVRPPLRRCGGRPVTSVYPMITARRSTLSRNVSLFPGLLPRRPTCLRSKANCAGCSISRWDSMSGFTSTNMDLDPTRSFRESSPLPRWERRHSSSDRLPPVPAPARTAHRCVARIRNAVREPRRHRGLGFLMRKDNPNPFYLDCHSAALLALTQAARIMQDARLPEAIERGIAAYWLAPQAIDLGTGSRIDTVGMASPDLAGDIGEIAFWNFKAGLSLRFFGALREIAEPGRPSRRIASSRSGCGFRSRAAASAGAVGRRARRLHRIPHLGSVGRDQLRDPALGHARTARTSVGLTARTRATLVRRRSCGGHESRKRGPKYRPI